DVAQLEAAHEVVAGRARLGADEGGGLAGESVEQATLAGVGPAGEHDAERAAGDGSLIQLFAEQRHQRQALAEASEQVLPADEVNVFLGEVEPRLDIGQEVE